MTLSITLDKTDRWGKDKVAHYTVVDDDGSGGTLDVSKMFNHIDNAILTNITTATWVSLTWTDEDESITIGSEGSGDTYKISVFGT